MLPFQMAFYAEKSVTTEGGRDAKGCSASEPMRSFAKAECFLTDSSSWGERTEFVSAVEFPVSSHSTQVPITLSAWS